MTARVRVMVVDDEEGIRFALKSFLELKGYAVTLADSCGEAEKLFRTTPVDLVVLDFGLPDGDGVELFTRLRAVDGFVPVVMLTAHGSIELAVRAIQKGMDQFLVKPVDLVSLGAVLEKVLEDHRARRRQLARRTRSCARSRNSRPRTTRVLPRSKSGAATCCWMRRSIALIARLLSKSR